MSMKWMRGSYHYIMATKTWDHSSVLCWGWHLQLAEGWYGMVLLPYGHPPHIKHAKRLLYVWDGFGMSMTWMRGPYHYSLHNSMIHVKNLHSHLSPPNLAKAIVKMWSKDTVIWLPTTYEVCQTPFICMKWIWYEYEVDGRSQSYPTACPKWETTTKSYDPAHPF